MKREDIQTKIDVILDNLEKLTNDLTDIKDFYTNLLEIIEHPK